VLLLLHVLLLLLLRLVLLDQRAEPRHRLGHAAAGKQLRRLIPALAAGHAGHAGRGNRVARVPAAGVRHQAADGRDRGAAPVGGGDGGSGQRAVGRGQRVGG